MVFICNTILVALRGFDKAAALYTETPPPFVSSLRFHVTTELNKAFEDGEFRERKIEKEYKVGVILL